MSETLLFHTAQFIDVPVHLLTGTPQEIVSHLRDSHRTYENQTIPRIEQQFLGLMKLYPNAPELQAIFNLFRKFQLEMQWHMKHEEQVLYPEFLSGKATENTHHISHEDQEPFLFEVIRLLKKAPYSDNAFCQMLISSLERFEEELRLHAWIEEHLLIREI